MSLKLHQQWYEVLASRASALGAVLLIASLAVLWLVYARFWWPRLLPLLRAALLVAFLVSLVLGVLYDVHRSSPPNPVFDPADVFDWADPTLVVDRPPGI
jgi:hypothetical protein